LDRNSGGRDAPLYGRRDARRYGDEFAGFEQGVLDLGVDRGGLGFLFDAPEGAANGGLGADDVLFRRTDLVVTGAEAGGFQFRLQRGNEGMVGVASAARLVEFRG
jgi:hypothetical protein